MESKARSVPIQEKVCMTIEDAAAYSSIGTKKIRELTKLPNCDFTLFIGNKTLIKRKEFDKFLSSQKSI